LRNGCPTNWTKHNLADPTGALLMRPKPKKGALKMNDFDFMISWIQWCRHTAQKLTLLEDGFCLESERRRNGSLSGLARQESKASPVADSSPAGAGLISGTTYATAALTRAPDSSA